MFKSKHNKYTQIPNWFESLNNNEVTAVIDTHLQIIPFGGTASDVTYTPKKIILYNKFILSDSEINETQLVISNTALVAKETESLKIGDLVETEGWNTSDFLKIAAGTIMYVQSTIDAVYGVVFYDNTCTVISGVNVTKANQSIGVPINAFYFRICSKLDNDFLVTYKVSTFYNSNQLKISNQNVFNYLELNSDINEGLHETVIEDGNIQLLVQNPLSLSRDVNNVIKISLDYDKIQSESKIDMFEWDKSPSAFGYDESTKTAYSFINGEQQFTEDVDGNTIPLMTSNQDFWQYDETAKDKWIIKALRPKLDLFGGLFEYDQKLDAFRFNKSIVTTGGIVIYADDSLIEIPPSSGGNGSIQFPNIVSSGDGNAFTTFILSEDKKLLTFVKDQKFVTENTAQTISGEKNFTGGLKVNYGNIYYDTGKQYWKLEGDLIVTGGITMFGSDSSFVPSTIMDAIEVDNVTIVKQNGKLVAIGGGNNGSGSNEIEWKNIIEKPNWITEAKPTYRFEEIADTPTTLSGYGITDTYTKIDVDDLLEGYIPITGGTISGDLRLQQKSSAISPYLYFGDFNEVWLKETSDTHLTIHSKGSVIIDTPTTIIDGIEIKKSTDGVLFIDANLVVSGGITMYSDETVDIPSIYDALPIDNDTIYWYNTPNGKVLKAKVGTGGSVTEITYEMIIDTLGYTPYDTSNPNGYITSLALVDYQPLITSEKKLSYSLISGTPTSLKNPNSLSFGSKNYDGSSAKTITASDLGALTSHQTIYTLTFQSGTFASGSFTANSANKTINIPTTTSHVSEGSNLYFTKARAVSALADTLKNYVTLSGTQTITGEKDFTGGLKVNGSPIVYDKTNKYWKLTGDLVVTGGITMFANDGTYTPSTIMDAILYDDATLGINDNGELYVKGGTGGGVADSVDWGNIIGKPSWITDTKPKYSYTEISETPDLSIYATKGATLAHYGIADAKISNGIITLGSNTITPLTQTLGDGRYVTSLGTSGNDLTWVKNGTTNKITIPYSVKSKELSSWKVLTIKKNQDSGTIYKLIANLTNWKVGYDAQWGIIGVIYGHRGGNMAGTCIQNIVAYCASYSSGSGGTNFELKTDVTTYIKPYIVSYNGVNYLALRMTGSGSAREHCFLGYTENLLDEFIEVSESSVSILHETEVMSMSGVQANSSLKLTTVSKTAWGQTYWTSGGIPTNISGDMSNVGNITFNSSSVTVGEWEKGILTIHANGVSSGSDSRNLWLITSSSESNHAIVFARNTTGSFTGEIARMNSTSFFPSISKGLSLGTSSNVWNGVYSTTGFFSSTLDVTGKVTAKGGMEGLYWKMNDTPSNPYLMLTQESTWYVQGYQGYLYMGAGSAKSIRVDSNGNLLTPGGITMYSDIRKKTKLRDVELTIRQIADAPLIEHYYNSDESKTTHVGSIAQYWYGMNDWFCKKDNEGFLTMEIQNAALASAISVARELVKFESETDKRIRLLEEENVSLRKEIEQLKWYIA